jgi:hypothetical protein
LFFNLTLNPSPEERDLKRPHPKSLSRGEGFVDLKNDIDLA